MLKKCIVFVPHVIAEIVMLSICALMCVLMIIGKSIYRGSHICGTYIVKVSDRLPSFSWYFGDFRLFDFVANLNEDKINKRD